MKQVPYFKDGKHVGYLSKEYIEQHKLQQKVLTDKLFAYLEVQRMDQ